jgi:hypothetical protein
VGFGVGVVVRVGDVVSVAHTTSIGDELDADDADVVGSEPLHRSASMLRTILKLIP